MSELQININLDNSAFGDNPADEVARILYDYCNSITKNVKNLDDKYSFIDFNGNQVGEAKVIKELPIIKESELYRKTTIEAVYPIEEKTKILVTMEGGIVQAINANNPNIDVLILDCDSDTISDRIKDLDNEEFDAYLYDVPIDQNSEIVNHYFNQFEE